jgi:iron complex transport system ATP-binding protein
MIRIENISLHYGRNHILHNMDLEFNNSEFICVLGPNGAGKSTLLKIISGWVKPTEGKVVYDTDDITDLPSDFLAKKRAFLTQRQGSFSNMTVTDTVMLGRYPFFKNNPSKNDIAIVEESMNYFGVYKYQHKKMDELSGGEQQRVHLARVLSQVNNEDETNKFLFLDEPVNNLDLKYQHLILEKSKALTDKMTVVSVMHDLNLSLYYADRIILMKQGEIVLNTTDFSQLTQEVITDVYEISTNQLKISHPQIFSTHGNSRNDILKTEMG